MLDTFLAATNSSKCLQKQGACLILANQVVKYTFQNYSNNLLNFQIPENDIVLFLLDDKVDYNTFCSYRGKDFVHIIPNNYYLVNMKSSKMRT